MSLTARPATGSNRMATGWLLWLAIIVVSASDAPAVPQLEPREVEIIRERFLRVAEKFRELTGNSAFLPTLNLSFLWQSPKAYKTKGVARKALQNRQGFAKDLRGGKAAFQSMRSF